MLVAVGGLVFAQTQSEHAPAGPRLASAAVAVPLPVLTAQSQQPDMNKIEHVVIIDQENRSFDEYFGMYPGADGIPVDGNG
ncbi:MAG: Phosphoesterase family, partial [Actinomycetota bacterium]|nr:Phosphoesterase family [Actinomycetota bacterium]